MACGMERWPDLWRGASISWSACPSQSFVETYAFVIVPALGPVCLSSGDFDLISFAHVTLSVPGVMASEGGG